MRAPRVARNEILFFHRGLSKLSNGFTTRETFNEGIVFCSIGGTALGLLDENFFETSLKPVEGELGDEFH
jgi:hypothetical protein